MKHIQLREIDASALHKSRFSSGKGELPNSVSHFQGCGEASGQHKWWIELLADDLYRTLVSWVFGEEGNGQTPSLFCLFSFLGPVYPLFVTLQYLPYPFMSLISQNSLLVSSSLVLYLGQLVCLPYEDWSLSSV